MQASIDDYLTVYPNLNASVKDVKDKEGKVTVATAKMLTANKGKSRLGASVSIRCGQNAFSENMVKSPANYVKAVSGDCRTFAPDK